MERMQTGITPERAEGRATRAREGRTKSRYRQTDPTPAAMLQRHMQELKDMYRQHTVEHQSMHYRKRDAPVGASSARSQPEAAAPRSSISMQDQPLCGTFDRRYLPVVILVLVVL
jgi:hypothetical protein